MTRRRVDPHPSVDLVRQLNITWLDKPYYNDCDCPLTLAIVKLIDYQIISYKDRPQVESRLYRVDNLEPADPPFTVGRFSVGCKTNTFIIYFMVCCCIFFIKNRYITLKNTVKIEFKPSFDG